MTQRQAFWDGKILSWERKRYGEPTSHSLARILSEPNNSLQHRAALALSFLQNHVKGKRVLELGCGSGRFARTLLAWGAASYTGIDFSAVAIREARARGREVFLEGEKAEFRCEAIEAVRADGFDLVFSLGLIDWLEPDALRHLAALSRGRDFLHSYSEDRSSTEVAVHRLYCFWSYGWRNGGYVPRYLTESQMRELFATDGLKASTFFRDPRLRFGTLITSLRLPEPSPAGS